MASLDSAFAKSFARETWTLYGVGVLGAVLRFAARIRRLGYQNLQSDDYLMLFSVVWYTLLCVALNEVASIGGSNLMDESDIEKLTPEIKADRIRGSKWVFVSEHSFLLAIYGMKACMLVIYARITEGLRQRKWVTYLAVYVALGFVGNEMSLFLICRPLSNYWAVPTPYEQCSTYQYYEIIQGCLSISADVFMLLIGLPLMVQVRVPLKQKLILLILFGMGIFVIVAAILNKLYCLVPSLISYVYMNWYFREATVAILVTNLPLVWSLLRDVFPALKSWTGGSRKATTERYRTGPWTSKGSALRNYGAHSQLHSGEYSMHAYNQSTVITPQKTISDASLEPSDDREPSEDGSERALRIRQDVTVTVERETCPAKCWESGKSQTLEGDRHPEP
ncbi:UbiD family decarboxylase [Aspergillus sclerotioniger CBS 115572]|uniref:UbiD family decarboxylase n=1 Tax=Aspergillus sclerotioniger CBS 115572 TaxID=1450535 RepID=A0A317WQM3_9EURO|nr:UbiD family decarboxylase [Aspergillus sclerotioniger CBS 115572]PWY88723.1 UbiD family decarboxylase [Aspergillus sclerotioniger CBS 115572]